MIGPILLWLTGIAAVIAVAIVLAFRFTPWPSVALIQHTFARGEKAFRAGAEAHVPAGIVTRRNLAYGEGPDEVFDVYYPQGASGPLRTIVWVHGGGWVAGSKDGIGPYLKVLAGHGYNTVGLEYSRGFGTTYPKPVEQVNVAIAHLLRNAAELNIDTDALVLAGDSAGAQIVSQLAVIVTDPAYAEKMGIAPALEPKQLAAVLLLSGAYDIEAFDLEGDYGWFLKTVLWAYSGTRNWLDDDRFRLISVTRHVTSAFPSAFISSGNGDPLAPQAVALAKRLEALGVDVDSLFFPADYSPPLPHEYQFDLRTPAGQEALKRMLAFLEANVPR